VLLDASVGELDDAGAQFATEDRRQGEQSGGDAVLVHRRVVLQAAVHQAHHQVELLVLQHGFGAADVLRQLVAQGQTGLFGLEGPEHRRKRLPGVRDFVLEYAVDAVAQHFQSSGRVADDVLVFVKVRYVRSHRYDAGLDRAQRGQPSEKNYCIN
jgi:hypothetical protein